LLPLLAAVVVQIGNAGGDSAPSIGPEMISPGVYQIGLVTLDRTNRTVCFPAAVNQRAGLVEYAVVTTGGKVHESIFRTEAQPSHIHMAMLLLGVKAAGTNLVSEDLRMALPGERVGVEVAWRRGRREVRHPLSDFVKLEVAARPERALEWVYNGSFLAAGGFAAQHGGSIISLITDPSALVNNAGPDRADDEIHQVRGKVLPGEDTRVEIILRPIRGFPADPSPVRGRR